MKSHHARETDSGRVTADSDDNIPQNSEESRPATIENAKETFWIGAQQNFCKILNEPLCDRILTSSLEQLRAETIKEFRAIIDKVYRDKCNQLGLHPNEWRDGDTLSYHELKQELEALDDSQESEEN